MATIKKEIELTGKCLMSGENSKVHIFPSKSEGIKFYNGGVQIEALAENVISTLNCTVLGKQDRQVKVVEHFMAACAFSGIKNLEVCLESSELPILDGSAKEWMKAFKDAGIEENKTEQITFSQPLAFNSGKTTISLVPAKNFQVTYLVNFDHPLLANKWISLDVNQNITDLSQSRTFGYLKDLEKFQKSGIALGVDQDNTIGLTEEGYTTQLRTELEPIKHKILDLIGDLMLTGINPLNFNAHIIAKEAGHKTHVEFANLIKQQLLEKAHK